MGELAFGGRIGGKANFATGTVTIANEPWKMNIEGVGFRANRCCAIMQTTGSSSISTANHVIGVGTGMLNNGIQCMSSASWITPIYTFSEDGFCIDLNIAPSDMMFAHGDLFRWFAWVEN